MPIFKVDITKTIYVESASEMDAAIFAKNNPDTCEDLFFMPNEVLSVPEYCELHKDS